MALKNAVVIAISHSGQTFPTMHATHTLRKICGDKVFVVAGAIDSKMSAAVGQMAHDAAPWISRVIPTYAGCAPFLLLLLPLLASTCSDAALARWRVVVGGSDGQRE